MWKWIILVFIVILGTALPAAAFIVYDDFGGQTGSDSSDYSVTETISTTNESITNSSGFIMQEGFVYVFAKGYDAAEGNVSFDTPILTIGDMQMNNITFTMNISDPGFGIQHRVNLSGFDMIIDPIVSYNGTAINSTFDNATKILMFSNTYLSPGFFTYDLSFNATMVYRLNTTSRDCAGYINALDDYCSYKDATATLHSYRAKAFFFVANDAASAKPIIFVFPKTWLGDGYLDWNDRAGESYSVDGSSTDLSLSEDATNVYITIGTSHTNSSLHYGEHYIILEWSKSYVPGGGGGGGTTTIKPPVEGGCLTNWTCSDWSECINGTQTRACSKIDAKCGASFRPAEERNCTAAEKNETIPQPPVNETVPEKPKEEEKGIIPMITGFIASNPISRFMLDRPWISLLIIIIILAATYLLWKLTSKQPKRSKGLIMFK